MSSDLEYSSGTTMNIWVLFYSSDSTLGYYIYKFDMINSTLDTITPLVSSTTLISDIRSIPNSYDLVLMVGTTKNFDYIKSST
jgi:hypothetical protein